MCEDIRADQQIVAHTYSPASSVRARSIQGNKSKLSVICAADVVDEAGSQINTSRCQI